jgi:thiamine pyrophosphate-dependent acetolactate synthase large subunit-like protein
LRSGRLLLGLVRCGGHAYRLVTAAAQRAAWVTDVPNVVDEAIRTAITQKRPVYVEINLDIWDEECPMPAGRWPASIRQRELNMTSPLPSSA